MDNLALEIRGIDVVEVHQPEMADPGRREIEGHRRAQPAAAHDQHPGLLQSLLAGEPNFGKDDVPAVPNQFGLRQGCGGHGVSPPQSRTRY